MTEQRTVNDFFMQQYFEKSVSLKQYSFKRPLVRVIYIPRVVTLVQLEVFELELRRLSCEGFRFIPHYQNLSHFSNLIHYSDNIYEPGSNEYLGTQYTWMQLIVHNQLCNMYYNTWLVPIVCRYPKVVHKTSGRRSRLFVPTALISYQINEK